MTVVVREGISCWGKADDIGDTALWLAELSESRSTELGWVMAGVTVVVGVAGVMVVDTLPINHDCMTKNSSLETAEVA